MIFELKNKKLKIKIADFGAELQSFYSNEWELELLWQADNAHWGRHAPLLFPIVGKLVDDCLIINSKKYTMKQHGFARDLSFELVAIDEKSIELKLVDSQLTKQQYPFRFELIVKYTLIENKLSCQFTVHNLNSEPMPFSLGGHPAFKWPLIPTLKKSNHQIRFDKKEKSVISKLKDGLIVTDSQTSPLKKNVLALEEALFENDALIFKNIKSKIVSYEILKDNKMVPLIEIHFDEFRDFGIWSKPDASFICLEPWVGFSSPVDFNDEFTSKPGIILLPSKSSKKMTFEIELKCT